MARKKAPPAPPQPTAERVAAALRSGDYLAALDVARKLHALNDVPENVEVRKNALAAAAIHFADADKYAEFNRVMAEAATLEPENAAWTAERAALQARGGVFGDALRLLGENPDPAARLKVLGFAADRALRRQSKEFLPEELHAGFDAIVTAFRHHETGNANGARELLEPIGLRSPYLEWKLLLRGLFAHADGDDIRAAENFARLDPVRLPARLAVPLRVAVDPAYRVALPADVAAALQSKAQKLATPRLVEGLRAIARELVRNRPLAPVFKAAEAALPALKQTAPHLVPRLAACLYHAISQQGQPDDLQRYRRLFGNPPDDPNFDKLQAIIREAIGERVGAHLHWLAYEKWLASNPAGWPAALLVRARAEIWLRLGTNAQEATDTPDVQDFGLFHITQLDKKKPKPLNPPADACFRRAVELAPGWAAAVQLLFEELLDAKKPAEAEAAARDFLKQCPDELPALESLAKLLQLQGRTPEAATLWLRALGVNPLDKSTRLRAAHALLAAARRHLIDGKPTTAETVFEQHSVILKELDSSLLQALRSVIVQKLGRTEDATTLRAEALAAPATRAAAAYRIMVDSQLAKLKPAEKKAADGLFAEELAKSLSPIQVQQLIASYDLFHVEAVAYRGQKTHEKKLLDLVPKCLATGAPEVEFELLGEFLVLRREWKIGKKFVDACRARFPKNPQFFLFAAQLIVGKGDRIYSASRFLLIAKALAEASGEPRHRAVLDRIDALLKEIDSPPSFGDYFGNFFE